MKTLYKPTKKICDNRKDMKDYLGGNAQYNKALKNNELIFLKEEK